MVPARHETVPFCIAYGGRQAVTAGMSAGSDSDGGDVCWQRQ